MRKLRAGKASFILLVSEKLVAFLISSLISRRVGWCLDGCFCSGAMFYLSIMSDALYCSNHLNRTWNFWCVCVHILYDSVLAAMEANSRMPSGKVDGSATVNMIH